MQLAKKMTQANTCKKIIRVVLDEPRLYVEESLGSAMVRGEVIVNFSKDTQIQGPIELVFEGIQKYQTWPEIMKDEPLRPPIETILQVIELSLLPPNAKGIMPAGVQRFPFEFPIPSTLPTTVFIRDRIEIFYQVRATIRKSSSTQWMDNKPASWIDWARRDRKEYIACSPIRIVHAIESHPISHNTEASMSPTSSVNTTSDSLTTQHPWNRRSLSEYQGTLDEQHDQLAFSLSGRTSSNLTQPIDSRGIRYKIGVDRTAIALGTSIGIELLIEPIMADVIVKSVTLNILEKRKYAMKFPSDHSSNIKKVSEGVTMLIKWAYGHQAEDDGDGMKKGCCAQTGGDRYVRKRSNSSKFLAYFDPPQPGNPHTKCSLSNYGDGSASCSSSFDTIKSEFLTTLNHSAEKESQDGVNSTASSSSSSKSDCDMINLKELNQTVKLGEYFGGRFVMPVPDCSSILHPSMDYESITISHWLQLVVTVEECNGKTFNLLLESPSRILDCRVVSVDDDCQTILPPPPSYQPGEGHLHQDWTTFSTFWEQREPITSVSGWGHCMPCPCQYKLKQKQAKKECQDKTSSMVGNHTRKTSSIVTTTANSNSTVIGICPPNLLPEWGPPPFYSEN